MQQRRCFQDADQMSSLKVMLFVVFFMGHFINLSDELASSRAALVLHYYLSPFLLIKSGSGEGKIKRQK